MSQMAHPLSTYQPCLCSQELPILHTNVCTYMRVYIHRYGSSEGMHVLANVCVGVSSGVLEVDERSEN